MKIKLGTLKRIINEENVASPAMSPQGGSGGGGLGKLLDDMSAQFAAKMKAQYPGADDAIQKEANDLKMQLTAQIKAAAAKVKMSAGGGNTGVDSGKTS